MEKRRGFTIIELTIVIVVMAILLVLGTVGFRGIQAASRDKEREADIQAIAAYLESIYTREIRSGATIVKPAGAYPSIESLNNQIYRDLVLSELEPGAKHGPETGKTDILVAAPGAGTITKDKNKYIYEPLLSTAGSRPRCLAAGVECRSFVLHYKLEDGNEKTLESKRK